MLRLARHLAFHSPCRAGGEHPLARFLPPGASGRNRGSPHVRAGAGAPRVFGFEAVGSAASARIKPRVAM